MLARREGDAKRNPPALLACGLALLCGALLVQLLPQLPPRWLDYLLLAVAMVPLCELGGVRRILATVIPAKAGIQSFSGTSNMDPGLRRDDEHGKFPAPLTLL